MDRASGTPTSAGAAARRQAEAAIPDLPSLLDLEREFFTSYFDSLAALRDNCFGVRTRTVGRATAYSIEGIRTFGYNRISGVVEDAEQLQELCESYPEPTGFGVDVTPGVARRPLLDSLAREGFAVRAFLNTYCGPAPSGLGAKGQGLTVRELDSGDASLFTEIFLACGMIPPLAEGLSQSDFAEAEACLLSHPRWTTFVAEVDGRPAAVARLFFSKTGAGFLHDSFCIPELRRRGCQSALLAARLERAAQQGAPYVAGQAPPETTSGRNLERAGLSLRSTKVVMARAHEA